MMLNELKAEFKKVFTIRSTYIIIALILVLVIVFGFYVGGWRADKLNLADPTWLFKVAQQAISFLSIVTALIGLLLLTHEFRYNLSAYSFTLSNSRNKVLLSKIIVISIVAVVVTVIVGAASPLLAYWGINANHLHLVHQTFSVGSLAWRGLVFGWGYAMAGLVIAALVRNQIGAIIVLFIVPNTVEGLFSILLKSNSVYMPFSSLHAMLGVGLNAQSSILDPVHAMYIFLGYLIVSWAIAWAAFLTKDAA